MPQACYGFDSRHPHHIYSAIYSFIAMSYEQMPLTVDEYYGMQHTCKLVALVCQVSVGLLGGDIAPSGAGEPGRQFALDLASGVSDCYFSGDMGVGRLGLFHRAPDADSCPSFYSDLTVALVGCLGVVGADGQKRGSYAFYSTLDPGMNGGALVVFSREAGDATGQDGRRQRVRRRLLGQEDVHELQMALECTLMRDDGEWLPAEPGN